MAKKGTKTNPIVISIESLSRAAKKLMDAEKKNDRSISIIQASIKDDFCHYKYEVISGKDAGFEHTVKGKGIISDDLRNALSKLNVHLAVIDDVYKHSGVGIESISTMHNDDLALLYRVTGFEIKGGDDNAAIIFIGDKYLSTGSRMDLKSPKVMMDNLSGYKWYNELKEAADLCREEVALYHYGKYTPVIKEEDEDDDEDQGSLFDKSQTGDAVTEEKEEDFENAKV